VVTVMNFRVLFILHHLETLHIFRQKLFMIYSHKNKKKRVEPNTCYGSNAERNISVRYVGNLLAFASLSK